jgi:hypothetical protein
LTPGLTGGREFTIEDPAQAAIPEKRAVSEEKGFSRVPFPLDTFLKYHLKRCLEKGIRQLAI